MGKKIQKLDVEGMYKVRMVVSDGVNQLTTDATMEAKIGNVNVMQPRGNVGYYSKKIDFNLYSIKELQNVQEIFISSL